MKLKALAPAALILFSGYALAQDASKEKYDADKAAAPAQTQQQSQSSSKAASPSTAQQGAQSNSQGQANRAQPNSQGQASAAQPKGESQGNASASASVTTTNTFATADSNKDGKLSIAEMKIVMPDVTIIDTDSDGYVNQKEAEASITGLTFSSGSDTALITAQSYNTIVAARDDDDLDVDLDDDADVEIKVEGDVDVEDTDN